MAKDKLGLSVEPDFKEKVRRLGEWYRQRGVDVADIRHGGISLSRTLAVLVEEKLEIIDAQRQN